jgi:hypothetical protein
MLHVHPSDQRYWLLRRLDQVLVTDPARAAHVVDEENVPPSISRSCVSQVVLFCDIDYPADMWDLDAPTVWENGLSDSGELNVNPYMMSTW